MKEGKGSNLDRDDSDDDNEVMGQVVLNTVEGMSICLVDVDDDDKEKGDDDVQEVVKHSLDSWNPFNSVDASKGYSLGAQVFLIPIATAAYAFYQQKENHRHRVLN